MRNVIAVLNCFLVAVVVGSAVGDEQDGATKITAEHVCEPEIGNQAKLPLFRTVPTLFKNCFDTLKGNTSVLEVNNAPTEAIQTYFKGMCQDAATFSDCLQAKASTLEVCSNPSILKLFNIMREFVVKSIETGCAEGGKLFVTLVQGFSAINEANPLYDEMLVCIGNMVKIISAVAETDADISSKMYILHTEFNKFVECFSTMRLDQPFREGLDHFTNELLATLKCIHPQDGTLVPCVSIRVDLITTPSVCEAKTHGSTLDLYDILENDAGRCFDKVILRDSLEKDITEDIEALRADVSDICDRNRTRQGCIDMATVISESCLTETRKKEFKHFLSTIGNAFGAACQEGGRRLGDIMFEVYRLKKVGQGHAVWDCIDVTKSTRNVADEHRSSSKNMRFYHEMEAFKGCLVNKLQGDQTSVAAATSLIDELLKKVECAGGAEDDLTVTCESLMHHLNNHNHH